MGFYVIRGRSLALALAVLILALAVAAVLPFGPKAVAASLHLRKLPIYSVETQEPKVSLGFNCAWDDEDIPLLLDALRQEDVKATFFLLGEWCEKYPDSVRLIADAGHEIASHSYSHDDMTAMGREELLSQIQQGQKAVADITGTAPELFRPPSGAYNDLVIDTIHSAGCIPIQWDVDTLDWKGLSVEEMVYRVTCQTKQGSILLLHSGAAHTAQALPVILRELKAQGLTPVPVGELIYKDSFTIDVQGRQHCQKT